VVSTLREAWAQLARLSQGPLRLQEAT
jgi:hypothetical protein